MSPPETRPRLARVWLRCVLLSGWIPIALAMEGLAQDLEPQPSPPVSAPRRTIPESGLPLRQFSGPREQLAAVGIDAEQLALFADGIPLGSSDEPLLRKVLFRMPQFAWSDLRRWHRPDVPWASIAENPGNFRAELFALDGRVTSIEQVTLPPDVAEPLEFDRYYRVQFSQPSTVCRISIYTREVPDAWQQGVTDQRARAWGLFLKLGPKTADQPELIFAARRIHWFPERVDLGAGVKPGHVLLAQLGMDIGLFDRIRRTSGQKMSAADREGFYELLAACHQANPETLSRETQEPFSLTTLLSDVSAHQGSLMAVGANARQITKVQITDPDVRQRLGTDHYFQIDGFIPLGEKSIRIGKSDQSSNAPIYTNSFPATFCVLRLPPELQAAEGRMAAGGGESQVLNEPIRVVGFFYRMWAYRSRFTEQFEEKLPQYSPMFIGITAETVSRPEPQPRLVPGLIGGGIVVVALGLVWYALRRAAAGDAEFLRTRRRR